MFRLAVSDSEICVELCRPVVHFLLLGTVVYQFFPGGKKIMIDNISWRFPLLGILSAAYINLWAMHYYVAGVWSNVQFYRPLA